MIRKPVWRIVAPAVIVLVMALYIHRNHASDEYKRIEGSIFGTDYRITYVAGPDVEIVRVAVEKELQRIDDMASTWKRDSELMRYQRSPEGFKMSEDLTWLLQRSDEFKEMTGGAFDVGYQSGRIDLSGIAKGYAVDCLIDLLTDEFGITSCLAEIGGEIKVRGKGPQGGAWNVGIYVPSHQNGTRLHKLSLRDTSIATSGNSFKGDHLIDPQRGEPAANGLLAVSVIHPSNTTADALATALYVMGPEEGPAWAETNDVRGIFFLPDGSTIFTRQ